MIFSESAAGHPDLFGYVGRSTHSDRNCKAVPNCIAAMLLKIGQLYGMPHSVAVLEHYGRALFIGIVQHHLLFGNRTQLDQAQPGVVIPWLWPPGQPGYFRHRFGGYRQSVLCKFGEAGTPFNLR